MGHRAADFDCIGACLGVARLCAFCGVQFNVIVNPKDPNFTKCYDRIKDLSEYHHSSVFCNAAEAQEMVGSDTLTVIVDVNNKVQLEAPAVAEISRRTVYIDHHRKTAEFEEAPLISYIEPSASSACELVSEILEQALPSGMLSTDEADIMYAGILLDTKQFTRNTGVRTFSAALYLRGEGANPTDAQMLFRSCLSDFISEAKFESNVVVYRKMMAISCNDDPDNTASDRIAAAKAADKLLTVEGVKASFALCRIEDKIHVSGRSSGEVNVQLIMEKLEGGGHFDSAATQLVGSMTEALTRLKGAIDEYFKDLATAEIND
jgi:c-di-AMP phosphodiesterase-like protein